MPTFAENSKATQQATTARSTTSSQIYFGHKREVNATLHSDEANAGHIKAVSTTTRTARFAHDFSRIPVFTALPTKSKPGPEGHAENTNEPVGDSIEAIQIPSPHMLNFAGIQTKLAISTPGDRFEREADTVADKVMSLPNPMLQRQCKGCSNTSANSLSDEEKPQIQRLANGNGSTSEIASDFTSGLGNGAPLDATSRSYFEPRFGHDFSNVRIHNGPQADAAAASVQARAFTLGRDVVFATGEYNPGSESGKHLLAHELTHVVQQSEMGGRPTLQRKCHATELGKPNPDCTPSQDGTAGWQFQFKVGCDDLLSGEEDKINKLKAGNQLKIHGFASKEGDADFNSDLSCHRANKIADLARRLRADCPIIGIFKHGASPVSAPGVAKDVNPPDFWRSVIVEQVKPPMESGEQWLDPNSNIKRAWALYQRAKVNPTQPNLTVVWGWRGEMKDWLTSIGKTLAPEGSKLTQRHLDDYRRIYASAEQLWIASDQLLALHKYPGADKDTYNEWAVGKGADQGDKYHAKGVPTGAKYHIDIFGEGYFKGAINIGLAERTTTTGIHDSRVPNLIYRKFSSKDANALPIADHTADLITSENGPIGYPGIAEEIARVIAPGGTIILFNPIGEEGAHDKVAKATGGTVKKDKSDRMIQTTIIVPEP
jgi:hypothetical protein